MAVEVDRTKTDASHQGDVTRLLNGLKGGDHAISEQAILLVYDELRRLARNRLRSERADHTLQTTALVNEAYVKFAVSTSTEFKDRSHFFAIASQLMRQILIDNARARRAKKRGGDPIRVTLDDSLGSPDDGFHNALVVNDALCKLEEIDARQARVVEMRFFAGLEFEQIAETLGISVRTVKRDWRAAQAWLYAELRNS